MFAAGVEDSIFYDLRRRRS